MVAELNVKDIRSFQYYRLFLHIASPNVSLVGYNMINITFFHVYYNKTHSISSLCAVFTYRSAENAENGENEDSLMETRIGAELLQVNRTSMFTLHDISLSFM